MEFIKFEMFTDGGDVAPIARRCNTGIQRSRPILLDGASCVLVNKLTDGGLFEIVVSEPRVSLCFCFVYLVSLLKTYYDECVGIAINVINVCDDYSNISFQYLVSTLSQTVSLLRSFKVNIWLNSIWLSFFFNYHIHTMLNYVYN